MILAMMVMIICSIIISQTSNSSSSGSRWARTKTKTFLECHRQNLFRTVEKSQTVWSQQSSKKKKPHFDHFPRPGEIDPCEYVNCFRIKGSVAWYRCVLYIWPSLVRLTIGRFWVGAPGGWAAHVWLLPARPIKSRAKPGQSRVSCSPSTLPSTTKNTRCQHVNIIVLLF